MPENQIQATIAESRRMFRRFVTVRYWNYSLGVAIGLGVAIAGSQITEGGYWMKLIAVVAAAGVVAVDVCTAVSLHGYYRSMMQQSERLGDSRFAASISPVQSIFLFSIAPAITFATSSCAVSAFCRIY
jgi:hypothetical protein